MTVLKAITKDRKDEKEQRQGRRCRVGGREGKDDKEEDEEWEEGGQEDEPRPRTTIKQHFHFEGDEDCASQGKKSYAKVVQSKDGSRSDLKGNKSREKTKEKGKGPEQKEKDKVKEKEKEKPAENKEKDHASPEKGRLKEKGESSEKQGGTKEKGDSSKKRGGHGEAQGKGDLKGQSPGVQKEKEVESRKDEEKGIESRKEGGTPRDRDRNGEQGKGNTDSKMAPMMEDKISMGREKRKREEKSEDLDEGGIFVKGNEIVLHKGLSSSPEQALSPLSDSPSSSEEEEEEGEKAQMWEKALNRFSPLRILDNDMYASSQEESEHDTDLGIETLHNFRARPSCSPIHDSLDSDREEYCSVDSRSLTPGTTEKLPPASIYVPSSGSGASPKKKQRAAKKLNVKVRSEEVTAGISHRRTETTKAKGDVKGNDKVCKGRKSRDPARPMQTLQKKNKGNEGNPKEFLVPLVISPSPYGPMLLSNIDQNEVLSLPAVPTTGPPPDALWRSATTKQILHESGTVALLSVPKRGRHIATNAQGDKVLLHIACLALRASPGDMESLRAHNIYWLPLSRLLEDNGDSLKDINLSEGCSAQDVAEWLHLTDSVDGFSSEQFTAELSVSQRAATPPREVTLPRSRGRGAPIKKPENSRIQIPHDRGSGHGSTK
ncbi:hypothetical protein CBR_g40864 [Chara braunii]|uniref:Uncharacterized protein n=1 Tax=Chara braunii TaxID=69332 RepID=A0A388K283_CHABU|nr:hypothetical protein CBR_g40864 [Chara braunii]|eukprot:GBG64164.1 hypothetical protein CBR_g40864 [Chara braunii]